MSIVNLQQTTKATAKQRYNFAVQHLLAAERFRLLCSQAEENNIEGDFGPFFEEIQSYATAAVLSSVAALEGNINEVYIDAIDEIEALRGLKADQMRKLWPHVEDKPILDKYQIALTLCGHDQMDIDSEPFQSVRILTRVRNALVHYKPEWHDDQCEHRKLGRQLRGRFDLSPFLDHDAPIFPMRCMTQGLADWAVRSVFSFASRFAERLEIKNRFSTFVGHFDKSL